jgi:hypothetical protein
MVFSGLIAIGAAGCGAGGARERLVAMHDSMARIFADDR